MGKVVAAIRGNLSGVGYSRGNTMVVSMFTVMALKGLATALQHALDRILSLEYFV
jgi:ABC-type transporter Mla maintaining outer membrane lipid asymmetry permease subunit MlaE